MYKLASLLTALTLSTSALAQDTVDIGVLANEDVNVVQKLLYPKNGKTELGVHLGIMPFDPFLTTPNLQLSLDLHQSETLAISAVVGGGYGLEKGVSNMLRSPSFGVSAYAYRYLASGLFGVQWAPIYGKLNFGGTRVVHFDTYLAGRAGVTLEQSIFPDNTMFPSPTVSPGIGARFFLGEKTALRTELRNDVLVQKRALTDSWFVKHNLDVTVGLTMLSGGK